MGNVTDRLVEILPCPFGCRTDGPYQQLERYFEAGPFSYRVGCRCGAQGPFAVSKTEAIKAWNRRINEQDN
jgi:hypothetical protein